MHVFVPIDILSNSIRNLREKKVIVNFNELAVNVRKIGWYESPGV
jgi:hypothetical protein